MNLHAIPKEITTPLISILWERAIAAFQRTYNNNYPIIVHVSNSQVYRVQYQRGSPLDFRPSEMQNWGERLWRETDTIQWHLITVVNDEPT